MQFIHHTMHFYSLDIVVRAMEVREQRHEHLVKLLESQNFSSQIEVCREMGALGYQVTQPSISRDFRELGVVKIAGRYLPAPRLTDSGVLSDIGELVQQVEGVGAYLIVVKTSIGAAQVVASKIDHLENGGLVGTVAGDDTIFVAVRSKTAQSRLMRSLKNLH